MEYEKKFHERLRSAGERISSPRLMIFQTIMRHSPLTIPRLVTMMQQHAINASTTYRNLALFRELHIINDIIAGGQRLIELSDQYGEHHHHFICVTCGMITDFDNEEIEIKLQEIAVGMNIQLKSHNIEMTGVCGKCVK